MSHKYKRCTPAYRNRLTFARVNNLVSTPAENCSESEQPKSFCLLEGDGRRHGWFLPPYGNFDQRRAVVLECSISYSRGQST